jgi:hypothetical protein
MSMRLLSLVLLQMTALSVSFASFADDGELYLPDLMSQPYLFPSGFQRSTECATILTDVRSKLLNAVSRPIREFRLMSVGEKIKEMHLAADLLSQSVYFTLVNKGDREIPKIVLDSEIVKNLSFRLKFLAESSRKKLTENTRELLVIANKLVPLAAVAYNFDRPHRVELTAFFRSVTGLRPSAPEQKVDHDLRSLALGNLAVLQVARLRESRAPLETVIEAQINLKASMREDGEGHVLGGGIESTLMVVQNLVAEIGAFSPASLPTIDSALVQNIKACRDLSPILVDQAIESGDSRRIGYFVGQLQSLLDQPSIIRLPDLRAEIVSLRDDFQRPGDPHNVQ